MKHLLLTLTGVLFGLTAICQINVPKTSDWKLIFEDEKVQLFSKYSDCEFVEDGIYVQYVLLKASNKTSQDLNLSWFNDVYYLGRGCSNCDHQNAEAANSVVIKANNSVEGVCAQGLNIGLRVFSKWTRSENIKELEKLVITDLKTTPIN